MEKYRFLNKETFLEKVQKLNSSYWNKSFNNRWLYMEPVINELISINPNTGIELGTAGISVMSFSDSMDKHENMTDSQNNTQKFIFDSKKTPWAIESKRYDVFVGLQVLEHLSPNQREVFKEIKRISKYAILTLPYKWNCKDSNDCHHMIGDEIIAEWTDNEIPYKKQVSFNRIMLCYKFYA